LIVVEPAMARTFSKAGMRVAVADVESGALEEARREVAAERKYQAGFGATSE